MTPHRTNHRPPWVFDATGRFAIVVIVVIAAGGAANLALNHYSDALDGAVIAWLLASLRWEQEKRR